MSLNGKPGTTVQMRNIRPGLRLPGGSGSLSVWLTGFSIGGVIVAMLQLGKCLLIRGGRVMGVVNFSSLLRASTFLSLYHISADTAWKHFEDS